MKRNPIRPSLTYPRCSAERRRNRRRNPTRKKPREKGREKEKEIGEGEDEGDSKSSEIIGVHTKNLICGFRYVFGIVQSIYQK